MRISTTLLLYCLFSTPSTITAQSLVGLSYIQMDCYGIYGASSKSLLFLDENTAVYAVTESPQISFNNMASVISYDTLDYQLTGDSILFFSRIDTTYLAARTISICKQQPFYEVIWSADTDNDKESERLRLTDDTLVLEVSISPLLQLYAGDFSLHVWRNKQEIYSLQLWEPYTHIRIPGKHFHSVKEKVKLVYELRYHINGEQHFALLKDTMHVYDFTHDLGIDFSPPIAPFPFRVLYPSPDAASLYFNHPKDSQCGYFKRVGQGL